MINHSNKTGYFLFSLDTELAWGHFDCFSKQIFSLNGQRERKSIHRLLDILHEFNITATWAVVGHLFKQPDNVNRSESKLDWLNNYPEFEKLYNDNHRLVNGSDIIETLLTKGARHEIAFHGHTHKVFNENKMSRDEAENEIKEWLKAFQYKNITPKTVIFPRDKVGHLSLFYEYGFLCYRGEENASRFYDLPIIGNILKRFYTISSFLLTPPVYIYNNGSDCLINLPSSRHLFGFNPKLEKVLDAFNLQTLRLNKFVKGIKKAAYESKVFHLYAHPYEFRSEKDFERLQYLFQHVSAEMKKGRLRSVSLSELAEKAST